MTEALRINVGGVSALNEAALLPHPGLGEGRRRQERENVKARGGIDTQ